MEPVVRVEAPPRIPRMGPPVDGSAGLPTRTTCPYCGVGCGVLATASGGISGDPTHPANRGRLCSKGTALGETLGLEERLLHPFVDGARTNWDRALDRVAAGFRDTMAAHGPDSVALFVSGQLLTEDYYAANKLAKGFLGTANIDSNSRLCMSSAVAAHKRSFGEDIVPGVYEDLELADLMVLVGSNLAWCHPVLFQRIQAARDARPGMRLVVIDPRRTATCEGADLHLPLAPGTDVALFLGLLSYLADAGVEHPSLDALLLEALTPAQAAVMCGLDPGDVELFFRWWTATERVVTLWSQGVNQSSAGVDKATAIINAHLLTGRIGRPGMGPFSVTGQPNAMGGREVGALSNLLAGHLEWDRPGDADKLRGFWEAPTLASGPGLKAVDLFRAVAERRVRALWVIGTNPAVSMPDAGAVRAALRQLDLLVVSDLTWTETVAAAHVALPGLAWGEKDGTVTNSERVISRQRPFIANPGETRPDWWMVAQVAARLGHGAAFAWRGAADIFREHAALSGHGNDGARLFDISGLARMDDGEYAGMAPTRWPVAAPGAAGGRLLGEGRFPHADGAARLLPTPVRAPAHRRHAGRPFALMTGRVRDQWHTMTRTGKTPRLFQHIPEPVLSIHPDDAGAMPHGSLAEVRSEWGSAVFRVAHDPGLRRDTVFAPMHWTSRFCAAAGVNASVNPAVDPISGQPELKHTPVSVAAWPARWHGFVLSRRDLGGDLAGWCATIPGMHAWRHELGGLDAPEEAFARLRARAGGAGHWLTMTDAATGTFRAALVAEGVLMSVVFLSASHVLPPRDWLLGLFGEGPVGVDARRSLLSGRPAGGVRRDPTVCVCHGVGAGTIRAAVAAGCGTVAAVGERTKAGTNCGSCRPEIASLLAEVLEPA